MKKFAIFLVILFIIIGASIFFQLPEKVVYKSLPLFLRFRYGIFSYIGDIRGGFKEGIKLKNVRLSRGDTEIRCEKVDTDIRFGDLISPDKEIFFNININKPKIIVGNTETSTVGFLGIPLPINTNIFISDAELFIKGLGNSLPISFSGVININRKNIKLNDFRILLGELEMEVMGGIDNNDELDLTANFVDSENNFSINGSLNRPRITTKWGGLETLFQIEDVKYNNGQLILSKIEGSAYIEGFSPIDLEGGLIINKNFIKFNNMTISKLTHIDGFVSKDRPSRIRLHMDNINGKEFAKNLPEILRVLFLSHNISADINIYGMMKNLQAGGILKLLSTPIEIACRYRKNKFSFRSIDGGIFNISGSINWSKPMSLKILGIVKQMDIKEFISFVGRKTDDRWKGIVDGYFSIKGDLEFPLVESKLEIKNAEFGDIVFDVAYLNLKGAGSGPIDLEHSMLYYKEVPAELTGYIDPKGGDIFKNIELKPIGENFIWEGINISKDTKDKIVTFGKDVNENIKVRFKSIATSDSGESGEEKGPQIELEYKLRDDKNLLIKMQEDEGTVGVEHKVKF